MRHFLRNAFQRQQIQPLGQVYPRGLAGRTLGDGRHGHQKLRDPLRLQLGAVHTPTSELLDAELLPVLQYRGNAHDLAQGGVRHGEGDAVLQGGMLSDDVLDLERRDLLAGAVDDLLKSAAEVQVAVGIDPALVAGAQPAVAETLGVRVAVHVLPELVTGGDRAVLDDDLALLADRQEAVVRVPRHNGHVRPSLRAHGPQLARAVAGVRADGHGLGHCISGHQCDFQHLFQLLRDRRHQSGRAIPDQLQLVSGLRRPDLLRIVQDLQMHGGHRRVPSGLWLCLQGSVELLDGEDAGDADDLRACDGGGQHIDDQAVDVKKRHGVVADVLLLHLHRGDDAQGAAGDVGMRQGHDLGLLRRTRGVQH
mmetsp:Transcript_129022/g.413337  ORF Transcript_129022/g.413337 Transcript_129022/m.413337 type:complete len:365 (-) Transcript_129022:757-1851(-)